MEVFLAIEGVLVAATITVWPRLNQQWWLVFFAGLGIASFAVIAERIISFEARNNEENRFILQRFLHDHFEKPAREGMTIRQEMSIIPDDVEVFDRSAKCLKKFRKELSRKLGVKGIAKTVFLLLAIIGLMVSCLAIYFIAWPCLLIFIPIGILALFIFGVFLLYYYTKG